MLVNLEFKATCPHCQNPDNFFMAEVSGDPLEDEFYEISPEVVVCCEQSCERSFAVKGKLRPDLHITSIDWDKF